MDDMFIPSLEATLCDHVCVFWSLSSLILILPQDFHPDGPNSGIFISADKLIRFVCSRAFCAKHERAKMALQDSLVLLGDDRIGLRGAVYTTELKFWAMENIKNGYFPFPTTKFYKVLW